MPNAFQETPNPIQYSEIYHHLDIPPFDDGIMTWADYFDVFVIGAIKETLREGRTAPDAELPEVATFVTWLRNLGYASRSMYDWTWIFESSEERKDKALCEIQKIRTLIAPIGGEFEQIDGWLGEFEQNISADIGICENTVTYRGLREVLHIVRSIILVVNFIYIHTDHPIDPGNELYSVIDHGRQFANDLLKLVNGFIRVHRQGIDLGTSPSALGVINHDSQYMIFVTQRLSAELGRYDEARGTALFLEANVIDLLDEVLAYAAYYRLLLKLSIKRDVPEAILSPVVARDITLSFPQNVIGENTSVGVEFEGDPSVLGIEALTVLRTIILNAAKELRNEDEDSEREIPQDERNITIELSEIDAEQVDIIVNRTQYDACIAAPESIQEGSYVSYKVSNRVAVNGAIRFLEIFRNYVETITNNPASIGVHGLQLGIGMTQRPLNNGDRREIVFIGINFRGDEESLMVDVQLISPIN